MSLNWKSSIPMLLWFVVLSILNWQNMLTGFYLAVFVSLGFFLLIPMLNETGVAKAVIPWVNKAGIFALLAASFALVSLTKIGLTWKWTLIAYEACLIGSAAWLFIGGIIGFIKWK